MGSRADCRGGWFQERKEPLAPVIDNEGGLMTGGRMCESQNRQLIPPVSL